MKQIVVIIFFMAIITSCRNSGTTEQIWMLKSPDSAIEVQITMVRTDSGLFSSKKVLNYRVLLDGKVLIEDSRLGIYLRGNNDDLTNNLTWLSTKTAVIDETYELPSGKKRIYPNHCNETTLHFKSQKNRLLNIVFRAYNDGIAFRYEIPGHGSETICKEASGFKPPLGSTAWGQPVDDKNDCHESSFETGIIGKDFLIGQRPWFPLLYTAPDTGYWVLLTEAGVYGNYCASHLEYKDGAYNVGLHDSIVTSTLPWETPWRVAVIGKTLAPIVETNIVENLNPPSEITDMSWIKPGRDTWTWWYSGDDKNAPKDNVDPAEWEKFASEEMGWECTPGTWWDWSGHYFGGKSYKKLLLEKGAIEKSLDDVLKKRSEEGIVLVKSDFMDGDSQERMKDYDLIAQTCLKNKIMINWHGARLPGGERRRWPNMIGYEAVRGAEYYKWSQGPSLFHRLTIPFTRNVVGPMDFTGVNLGYPADGKRNNTDAAELATAVLYENGVQYWGSNPEEYRKRPAAMSFLKKCPAAWETTRFVDGYPGKYVCMARQMINQDTWLIGAMTNSSAEDVKCVSFSFLPTGKQYELELYHDGERGSVIVTDKMKVTSTSVIPIHVLVNGGFCGILEPIL